MSALDANYCRKIVGRAVDRFGTVQVAEMAGVPVETVHWWVVLPDSAADDHLPPYGTIQALCAQLDVAEHKPWDRAPGRLSWP